MNEEQENQISVLKNTVMNYNFETSFKIGDIVKWKKGLKNKHLPMYEDPCIIVEVLEKPFKDRNLDVSSPYFAEKLDVLLGLITVNGDFFTFYYDKNRFELCK